MVISKRMVDKGVDPTIPYVFILDIDGTMVGRVDYQSQQHTLHSVLRQSGFKPVKQHPIPPAFYANAKLVRDGLSGFVRGLQKHYRDHEVHFFIYTGSEKVWANQEIAWIEKTHNIKFARPIFTRDDCIVDAGGNIRKSIVKIWPRVLRAIGNRNPLVLQNQTMIIDNNAVYIDHMDKLLLCPDYSYFHFENLLNGIPMEARKHPNVDKLILSFINQGMLCPYIETLQNRKEMSEFNGMRNLARQYKWLASKCKTIADKNDQYKHDRFWPNLKKLIIENDIRKYAPSTIATLQNTVWKRHKATAGGSAAV